MKRLKNNCSVRVLGYYTISGRKTAVWTKTSRGSSHKDISDDNLRHIAKECRLSMRDFVALLECPLSRDDYEARLIEEAHIGGPENGVLSHNNYLRPDDRVLLRSGQGAIKGQGSPHTGKRYLDRCGRVATWSYLGIPRYSFQADRRPFSGGVVGPDVVMLKSGTEERLLE